MAMFSEDRMRYGAVCYYLYRALVVLQLFGRYYVGVMAVDGAVYAYDALYYTRDGSDIV